MVAPAPAFGSDCAPLWRRVQELIHILFGLFGGPGAIAAMGFAAGRTRRAVLRHVRAAEAALRAALFAEALTCVDAVATSCRGRAQRTWAGIVVTHEADRPQDWRVAFRTLMEPGETARRRAAPRALAAPRLSAWPLAERAEALLRAFNAPERIIKRLARRLARAPARIVRIARQAARLAIRMEAEPEDGAPASPRRVEDSS